MVLEFVVGVVLRKEWKLMRRRAKCKWWLDFSTKWYSKKPYTPFPQSYELGCFSSMFVVVVCLFVCLSICLIVWVFLCLVGLLVGFFCLFFCLFDCFVCLFECLIVCLLSNGEDSITHFATSVNHKPQCKILSLLEACLMEELVCGLSFLFCRNLLFCSILVHIFSPSILWALGMLIAVPER